MSEVMFNRNPANYSKIKKVRVWGKGQFTIPSEIRKRLEIQEDTILEVFQIGRVFIATPERLKVKELASSVRKEMASAGLNLEQLLAGLREGNHEYEAD